MSAGLADIIQGCPNSPLVELYKDYTAQSVLSTYRRERRSNYGTHNQHKHVFSNCSEKFKQRDKRDEHIY